MGAQLSVDPSVHVVIVWGIAAARQLKSQGAPFTLLDLKDAFHHNVGALWASVQRGCLTMLVTLGRDNGVCQINSYKAGSLVDRMAKSKDLFAGKSWKDMGQSIPQ